MKSGILTTLVLLSLLPPITWASQEQLATSIKEARIEATRAADQLKAALETLTALTKQKEGDLRPVYSAFAAEIPKTEAAAQWTRARVQWMASDGQKYFDGWQKTVDGIANASLRKTAQKRLDSVRKSYGKVEVALKAAAEKFQPFLADLTDIQKVLSTDVTAKGVKAVKSTVSNANWRHQGVSYAINNALREMQNMEKALSSEAK